MFVNIFVYLRNIFTRDGSLDSENNLRIKKKPVKSFGKVEKQVWPEKDNPMNTKISIYQLFVLTVLLYSLEINYISPSCQNLGKTSSKVP